MMSETAIKKYKELEQKLFYLDYEEAKRIRKTTEYIILKNEYEHYQKQRFLRSLRKTKRKEYIEYQEYQERKRNEERASKKASWWAECFEWLYVETFNWRNNKTDYIKFI